MTKVPFERIETLAQEAARAVDKLTPVGWGFLIFLTSHGDAGYTTYVSSIEREDAVRMIEEWMERMKVEGFESTDIRSRCWLCGTLDNLHEIKGPLRSVTLCAKCDPVGTL